MRESRCLVHGILNFFFAVLLPYLMLPAQAAPTAPASL